MGVLKYKFITLVTYLWSGKWQVIDPSIISLAAINWKEMEIWDKWEGYSFACWLFGGELCRCWAFCGMRPKRRGAISVHSPARLSAVANRLGSSIGCYWDKQLRLFLFSPGRGGEGCDRAGWGVQAWLTCWPQTYPSQKSAGRPFSMLGAKLYRAVYIKGVSGSSALCADWPIEPPNRFDRKWNILCVTMAVLFDTNAQRLLIF